MHHAIGTRYAGAQFEHDATQGMLPMNNSVDQINALMKSEAERIGRIIKLSGAKAE